MFHTKIRLTTVSISDKLERNKLYDYGEDEEEYILS